ncbi:hypothetical protein HRI_000758700 [Hibiscus trionum]|uniref:Reverse transcriptase Ty1/copia-type domain-containing protein n=1 Tax=Hibiscus trionum TaxID=183268 RepID=A0A9W7LND2_HIBTR|nr:hypothetical protein HRI_000758700 [Hibiscus trionum]
MARTMLYENNLPKSFWAEATNTACYIINRVMIRPILKKTPFEILKSKKPKISYFQPFGCKCFVLNNGKDNLESIHVVFDDNLLSRNESCDDDDVGIIEAIDGGQTSKVDGIPTKEEEVQDPPLEALKELALEEKEVTYPREFIYVKGGEILGDPSNGDMLKKFGLENVKPQATSMSSSIKLDKDEGGKFHASPRESHLVAIQRIFRYLRDTPCLGLWYPKDSSFDLHAFSDADYGGSLSTTEAEYMSLESCCAQVLWMKQQLLDYGVQVDIIPFMCDNTSVICLTKNPIQHSRTKHI